MKFIKHEAEGQGKCADQWSPKRLQYKACNMQRCIQDMKCNKTLDVVLLIDGSGSLGEAGWDASITAAKRFIAALASPSEKKVDIAVILFSGPRTWSGVNACIGQSDTPVSLSFCGIKTVTSFTNDMTKVTELVDALAWPKGSTLTSLALMTAKGMLNMGRANVHSVVVVITDGRPLSYRKTTQASHEIRKIARLVWVPVTSFAPLAKIKEWATRRWQENVVSVDDFETLAKAEVMTHVIADICPDEHPEIEFVRPTSEMAR
jgi:Mg-chelatase subunit ChlD